MSLSGEFKHHLFGIVCQRIELPILQPVDAFTIGCLVYAWTFGEAARAPAGLSPQFFKSSEWLDVWSALCECLSSVRLTNQRNSGKPPGSQIGVYKRRPPLLADG